MTSSATSPSGARHILFTWSWARWACRTLHLRIRRGRRTSCRTAVRGREDATRCFDTQKGVRSASWMLQSITCYNRIRGRSVGSETPGGAGGAKGMQAYILWSLDSRRSCSCAACAWQMWMTRCKQVFWQRIRPLKRLKTFPFFVFTFSVPVFSFFLESDCATAKTSDAQNILHCRWRWRCTAASYRILTLWL